VLLGGSTEPSGQQVFVAASHLEVLMAGGMQSTVAPLVTVVHPRGHVPIEGGGGLFCDVHAGFTHWPLEYTHGDGQVIDC